MTKNYFFQRFILLFVITTMAVTSGFAQAFKKKAWVINLSEGKTYVNYSTQGMGNYRPEVTGRSYMEGERDPICVEYGLSNRWGISLSSGTDFYNIDPAAYYGFSVAKEEVKVNFSEFTIDANYHFYVSARTDLSFVFSFGPSTVTIQGKDGYDGSYQYKAAGGVLRLGAHARYYFYKRLGVLGMISYYSSSNSTEGMKGNTVANNYSTSIGGWALESGLCFRITK